MFLKKNTTKEVLIIIGISIYAFYVNWISGNIGVIPIDSFGFLDTGHSDGRVVDLKELQQFLLHLYHIPELVVGKQTKT